MINKDADFVNLRNYLRKISWFRYWELKGYFKFYYKIDKTLRHLDTIQAKLSTIARMHEAGEDAFNLKSYESLERFRLKVRIYKNRHVHKARAGKLVDGGEFFDGETLARLADVRHQDDS